MTKNFFIEFANETDQFTLKFNVIDTDIGNKWLEALRRTLQVENPIRENDRLYNFPAHQWSENKIIDIINDCIKKINEYKPFIDITAIVGGDQNHHNQLHKYFELMRGHIDRPNKYFADAPREVRKIIDLYNNTIHRLENHLRIKNKVYPRIVITFTYDLRYPLADKDFDEFTTLTEFGTVYLDYCEVGKTLLNVFHDKDNIVGDKSIIPQRYYSAGLCVKFYDGAEGDVLKGFWDWWNENENHLNELGFFKGDKTLSIGYLPVAKLDFNNMSKKEIISKIEKFTYVNRVYIGNNS